jgi:hypothetical protein
MPKMNEILIHDLREILRQVPPHCRTYLFRNNGSGALRSEDELAAR